MFNNQTTFTYSDTCFTSTREYSDLLFFFFFALYAAVFGDQHRKKRNNEILNDGKRTHSLHMRQHKRLADNDCPKNT